MTKEKLQFFVQGNRHVFLPPSCLNHHVTTSLGFSLLREKQGRRLNRPTKLLHAYLACEVCETRTVCKRHANELALFHLNCLFNRKLLKITQRDKVPDTKVVSLAGLISIHTPGIVNRTFENRTQSNSIRGSSSIEFGNRTKSNTTLSVSSISEQIEFNRTNRTQSNSIRLIVFD